MKIFNLVKKSGHNAKNSRFRVVFFVILCSFILTVNAFPQAKKPAPKLPPAEKKALAHLPGVAQIDDAKIRELLKPNGKPLLVNFWATWCVPCREEFPDLVKIDADYRGKVDFITVSLDFVEDINDAVPKFLGEMKAEMPAFLLVSDDENALISTIARDWSGGLPFTILYNEKGEVAYFTEGKIKPTVLRKEVEKLIPQETVK